MTDELGPPAGAEGVPEELVAHKVFGGDRPSSQILINALTPCETFLGLGHLSRRCRRTSLCDVCA